MKKLLTILAVSLVAAGAYAADLTVDAKFDLTGKDTAGSYLTFKGALGAVDKAQVDPAKVDALSGASTQQATDVWNGYRPDVKGKATFPAGFQSLVKYPVSAIAQYNADLPKAWKNADGSITFQYVHRGTAYKFSTDKDGKLVFPLVGAVARKIGNAPAAGKIDSVISKDFSKDGTVAGVDWAKVWDASVAGDKVVVEGNPGKTGAIIDDKPASVLYQWVGALQVTLNGTVVTVKGELNAEAVK